MRENGKPGIWKRGSETERDRDRDRERQTNRKWGLREVRKRKMVKEKNKNERETKRKRDYTWRQTNRTKKQGPYRKKAKPACTIIKKYKTRAGKEKFMGNNKTLYQLNLQPLSSNHNELHVTNIR